MECKQQPVRSVKPQPRIIIHGGAGNIVRKNFPHDKYQSYRSTLLGMIAKIHTYMNSNVCEKSPSDPYTQEVSAQYRKPSALDVAVYAVTLLEDNALFNSGHGAVFTRDGINELEASVMVSRGYKKRGVGVMGLRRVRNPILLAKKMLEHGEQDLEARASSVSETARPDVPSAQGHTQLWGPTAEKLAIKYGLDMVEPGYFFTQQRWDEHVRALEREKAGAGIGTWDKHEYLPQGTCGAVALDEDGMICVTTSTGGMTNKLTGRIGDTPVVGAGFWAEEWMEGKIRAEEEPGLLFAGPLMGLLADCLPMPWAYIPLNGDEDSCKSASRARETVVYRSMGTSGTGNGDSFLRISAARTAAAMARWKPESTAKALTHVAGPAGELQRSAGDRWGHTGEGEGGMIGIECTVERDAKSGRVVGVSSEVVMDYNCGGMYRAWVDDKGVARMSIWENGGDDPESR